MRVIGIDPGYDRLGLAIVDKEQNVERLVFSTCIETDRDLGLPERLFDLGTKLDKIMTEYKPDLLAIETLFFNKNIKTAINVAEARGVVLFLGEKHSCLIEEFGPQEIKVAVTGYGKSDKNAVIDMVKRLVKGVPLDVLDDEYDAIAVGITALAHHR
ncbi:crossover junction endodeoxyribonuclease RuvC [Candidatus Kaiserbacteria bacterium]|nr:crossover junction endodeoxyribonuclease RuvC [Candidatus Kaiserbacteria bacterium]